MAISNGPGAIREVSASGLGAIASETVVIDGKAGPARYAGPRLWAVLVRSGVLDADLRERPHEIVVVTGSDGYAVPLALAEIDPDFDGKAVLLATTRQGQALGRPRLIVPGDKKQGRDVGDIAALQILPGKP